MRLPQVRMQQPPAATKQTTEVHRRSTNDGRHQTTIVWRNVLLLGSVHLLALASLYSFLHICWCTLFYVYTPTLFVNLIGVTAGGHRLWAHRAYKAKLPLRIFLMICQTIALQNDIYVWVRDHRVHHKFSESDADPHNASRGFFFAHMGWLLCRKHPDVKLKGASIDLSDLREDPVVMFQHRYYLPLVVIFWFLLPTLIPYLLWNESILHAFLTCVCFRYVFALHSTWTVNSIAHLYGHRPYDKRVQPRENEFVIYASFGEGYHNFHHVFPYDYATSEFGWLQTFNLTTLLIDFFAYIGQVEERKTVPRHIVQKRVERTGDGLPNQRIALLHQLTGILLGTVAIWLPSSLRILLNYLHNRHLLT